jgi:hypothetical protein
MSDKEDFDFEITPEFEAELRARMQEADEGFYYTSLVDEKGQSLHKFECNKCKRIGDILERPFPHRYDCPMKNL